MKRFWSVPLLLAVLLPACGGDSAAPSVETGRERSTVGSVWMAIEPTQCLTNPWEQDWLSQPDHEYGDYPRIPGAELTPKEIEIITDYYARQGVVVQETAAAPKYETVCLACTCPEGHTLFLRVRPEDAVTMESLGYRREAPPE
jgi:hypothetical protein